VVGERYPGHRDAEREHGRRTEALDGPAREHHGGTVREARAERAEAEGRAAADEHRAVAHDVAKAPRRRDERRDGQHVRVHHPAGQELGEAEVLADCRQRHSDEHLVQQHDPERRSHRSENPPPPRRFRDLRAGCHTGRPG
jgi:hypothetical protein